MRDDILEKVSMDLLSIPPLVFRAVRNRITRTTLSDLALDITPHQLEIVRLLDKEGTLHVSEISERLQIAKAQMTKLIDRLVALKIVERNSDAADRRTYNIVLAAESRAILQEHRRRVIEAVREIMSSLSDEELEALSLSLRHVRDILLSSTSEVLAR